MFRNNTEKKYFKNVFLKNAFKIMFEGKKAK